MSESTLHHELESLGGTGGIASDHGIGRHDLANLGGPRVETRRGDLIPERVSITVQLWSAGAMGSLGMPNPWQ